MISSLNRCWFCRCQLGLDDYDGTCSRHDGWPFREEQGRFRKYDEEEQRHAQRRKAMRKKQ